MTRFKQLNQFLLPILIVACGLFVLTPSARAQILQHCPLKQGFWKNNPAAWPQASLVLGSSTNSAHRYSKNELLALLDLSTKGDASLILSSQLIAAKLNILNGSNSTPISGAVTQADSLLATLPGKLPYRIGTATTLGKTMVATALVLENYNANLLPGSCGGDTTAPNLAVSGPQSPVNAGSTVRITVEYSDAVTGINLKSLQIKLDGTPITSLCSVEASAAICDLLSVTAGKHQVDASISDLAGNPGTATFTFQAVAVTGPPVISNLVAPTAIALRASASLTFDYADPDGDIASAEISQDNALGLRNSSVPASALQISGTSGHVSLTITTDKLTFGSNLFGLRLKDAQGNLSNQVSFNVNVTGIGTGGAPPSITSFTVVSPWNRPLGAIDRLRPAFELSYLDADADIERVRLRVTRANGETTTTEVPADKFDLGDTNGTVHKKFFTFRSADPLGTYSVAILLIDRNGNMSNTATASINLVDAGGLLPPAILSFNPQQGAPGTEVVLSGSGFKTAGSNDNRVELGGVAAEIIDVTSTTLTVIVPEGAQTGKFTVRNSNGGAASANDFTVPPSVKLTPTAPSLVVGKNLQFKSAVYSSPSTNLIWSVSGIDGGDSLVGTITSQGVYTAPANIPTGGSVLVNARLSANPSVAGQAQVFISPPAPTLGSAQLLASVGGIVNSEVGGAAVSIPPGALSANSQISVTALHGPTTPPAPSGKEVLAAARFEPSGTVFNTPVTITLPLVRYFVPGTQLPLFFYSALNNSYQGAGVNAVVDGTGTKASAFITHFSEPAILGEAPTCEQVQASPPTVSDVHYFIGLQQGMSVPLRIIGSNLTYITPRIYKSGILTGEIYAANFIGGGDQAGVLLEISGSASGSYILRLEKGSGCGVFVDIAIAPTVLPALFIGANQTVTDPPDGRYSSIRVEAGGMLRITRQSQDFESTGPVIIDGIIDATGAKGADSVGRVCGGISPNDPDPDENCGQQADVNDGRGGLGNDGGDAEAKNFGADAPRKQATRGVGGEPGHDIDLGTILADAAEVITDGIACVGSLGAAFFACTGAVSAAIDLGLTLADALEGPSGRAGSGSVRLSDGAGGGGAGVFSITIPPYPPCPICPDLVVAGGGGGAGGRLGNRIAIKTPSQIRVNGGLMATGGTGGDGSNRGELLLDIPLIPNIHLADMPAFRGGSGGGGSGGSVRLTSGSRIAFSSSPDTQATAQGGVGGTGSNISSVGADGNTLFQDPSSSSLLDPAQISNMIYNGSVIQVRFRNPPGITDPLTLRVEGENGQLNLSEATYSPATGYYSGTVVLFQGFNVVCLGGAITACQGMDGVERKIVLSVFADSDGDGLSDADEVALGTNPNNADTDGDGLNDKEEIVRRTNPLKADTDGDGLKDGEEVTRGTDPLKFDTDGDGHGDGIEVANSWDPLDPRSPGQLPPSNYVFTRIADTRSNQPYFNIEWAQIGEAGHVAFAGNLWTGGAGISRGIGGPLTSIYFEPAASGPPYLIGVRPSGEVAFAGVSGLNFFGWGTGGPVQMVPNGFSVPFGNDPGPYSTVCAPGRGVASTGDIVVRCDLPNTNYGLHLLNPNGTLRRICDSDVSVFPFCGGLTEISNDGNIVAQVINQRVNDPETWLFGLADTVGSSLQVFLDDGDGTDFNILDLAAGDNHNAAFALINGQIQLFRRNGVNAEPVATGNYAFGGGEFAINGSGWVAFLGTRATGPSTSVEGLYIGPAAPGQSPVKVIEVGDLLPAFFNLPVQGIFALGMNNANQLVFVVTMQGGTQVILRADPTPP